MASGTGWTVRDREDAFVRHPLPKELSPHVIRQRDDGCATTRRFQTLRRERVEREHRHRITAAALARKVGH